MSTRVHHLEIGRDAVDGNGGLGRYVFLPGSPNRARLLAEKFDDMEERPNSRGHTIYLGTVSRDDRTVDVAAVSTGMGCPSVEIIVGELIQLGARRFLRCGTAGTLQDGLVGGDIVVASAAVRDEGASDSFLPREFPAVADPVMTEVLCSAARRLGLAEHTWCGVVHTKDSFFGREFGHGPDAERNRAYIDLLTRGGVLASEMEAAHLFVMGSAFAGASGNQKVHRSDAAGVRCGALLAIIGDPGGFYDASVREQTEARLVDLAIEGIIDLALLEG